MVFYPLGPNECSFHFFILNVFDSGHVGYCKKKTKSLVYFCLKTLIKTICRRVTPSPNPTFLYLVSPCFRLLVNPVVINTCVWLIKKKIHFTFHEIAVHTGVLYMNIYEAQGLKNISIQLGILVLLCTFWKYSSQEKEFKILILFMPFFLKNSLSSYTVVFLLIFYSWIFAAHDQF